MISARNYAAAAQRDLLVYAEALAQRGPEFGSDVDAIRGLSADIGNAVHFALPDGGMILDDKLRGLSDVPLRLPYPAITIEYYLPREKANLTELAPVYSPRRVLLAEEADRGEPGFLCRVAYEIDGVWVPAGMAAWIPSAPEARGPGVPMHAVDALCERAPDAPMLAAEFLVCLPGYVSALVARDGEDRALAALWNDISAEVRALHELLEALSCINVGIGVHQAEAVSCNAKRVKSGKLPLWETKCLMLNPWHGQSVGTGARVSGRAGPRQHLRRGHIRRLGDGRNVWVNSCVVGARSRGVVEKTYAVGGAA